MLYQATRRIYIYYIKRGPASTWDPGWTLICNNLRGWRIPHFWYSGSSWMKLLQDLAIIRAFWVRIYFHWLLANVFNVWAFLIVRQPWTWVKWHVHTYRLWSINKLKCGQQNWRYSHFWPLCALKSKWIRFLNSHANSDFKPVHFLPEIFKWYKLYNSIFGASIWGYRSFV